MMANGGDHGKHPWGEGPSHDGRQPPSHQATTEGAIATWEDELAPFEHALGRACMKHDAEYA
jgi:hypothetical protein